jgi:uncharacterized protein
MSELKSRILEDIKSAMKAKQKETLSVLRMLTAAIKQREVDERIELSDQDVLAVIEKMIKQRKEALSQFQSAAREDLAAQEAFEIAVLTEYMPEPLSDAEVEQCIMNAIEASGASSIKDMAKVMAVVKTALQGKADMAIVSQKVKEKLS